MRSLLLTACVAALLMPTLRAADDATAPAAAAAPNATPAAPAKPTLAIADAVEGILDEDEPTRKAALERLEVATEADIPALEKFEDAQDPEIKRHVALVLQRLRRGELSFLLAFPDGTPVANQKVNVKLTEIKMPEPEKAATDDGKQADANGVKGNQIQIQGNGQVLVRMVGGAAGQVLVNGQPVAGGLRAQPTYRELFNEELTTDAAGKLSLGKFNDGKYAYQLTVNDGLPTQNHNGQVDLTALGAPGKWELRHGVNAKVKVLDADGKPVVGITVVDLAANAANYKRMIDSQGAQALRFLGNLRRGVTDENGVAELEGIGLQAINLAVIGDGYEFMLKENVEAVDGKPLALDLQVEKIKPVEVTLVVGDVEKKDLKEFRFLLFTQADYPNILVAQEGKDGQNSENAKPAADKFDYYLKAGAIDLGKPDENGKLTAKLISTAYVILAAPADNSDLRLGTLRLSRIKAGASAQLQMRDPNKPVTGRFGNGVIQARPIPAPAPVALPPAPEKNVPAPAPEKAKPDAAAK